MAEKEDYIVISKKDFDYKKGHYVTRLATQMSRQEAIEKIARAICRAGENECIGDCASCDLWEVGPEKDYAEAALNALLERE